MVLFLISAWLLICGPPGARFRIVFGCGCWLGVSGLVLAMSWWSGKRAFRSLPRGVQSRGAGKGGASCRVWLQWLVRASCPVHGRLVSLRWLGICSVAVARWARAGHSALIFSRFRRSWLRGAVRGLGSFCRAQFSRRRGHVRQCFSRSFRGRHRRSRFCSSRGVAGSVHHGALRSVGCARTGSHGRRSRVCVRQVVGHMVHLSGGGSARSSRRRLPG